MNKEQFKIFNRNIHYAARTISAHLHFRKLRNNQKIRNFINTSDDLIRFWRDYEWNTLFTSLMTLGKVFDEHPRSHNGSRFLNSISSYLSYFSKERLESRKLALGLEKDLLVTYLQNVHELSIEDVRILKRKLNEARQFWMPADVLRNKILAHDEILGDDEREAIYAAVQYDDLEQALKVLLNIIYVIEQAELNGRQPDLTFEYTSPLREGVKSISQIISKLTGISLTELINAE